MPTEEEEKREAHEESGGHGRSPLMRQPEPKLREGDSGSEEKAEGEEEAQGQEVRVQKGLRDPGEPTPAEREEHERTHVPYRSWCSICVRTKAKGLPHNVQEKMPESVGDVLGLDY